MIGESAVAGEVLPWHDLMFEGPFPAGLDLDTTSAHRAAYFAATYPDGRDAAETFRARDQKLRTAPDYTEVVLWFEHDLLDQLQMLQLLDWFAGVRPGAAALTLVCIDRFPGIEPFRGLGQLPPDQLASLFDSRVPVGADRLRLARQGWDAFRAPDPTEIERFLEQDLTALPFLHAALSRHLEEFPSVVNGLSRTDQQILELVSNGVDEPGALFQANMGRESVLFHGDWCTFRHVAALCEAPDPLLCCTNAERFRYPPRDIQDLGEFRAQRLAVTETGRRVLAYGTDAQNPFDRWLGGVRLRFGAPHWRWNPATSRLQHVEA